ncbi:MAG TPA: hypothetical protein VNK43_06010 [Gemmatimonadales bacterium]|nr:hypothetical protein [Gemmatimonadales bacterium]
MTPAPPVLLAWSGGKDSTLALEALRAGGREVAALLTTITAEYERISMHGVRRSLLERQAGALGLPLVEAPIPPGASNAEYEAAFARALERARTLRPDLRTIAFGDLFLTEIRAYRERLLAALGWEPLFPVWGLDTAGLAREFIRRGHRAIIVCVDTHQAPGELAGRDYDESLLSDLPPGADPCGERGEFHTFVHAGPLFRHPVTVRRGERVLREGRFMYCDLLPEPSSP